jgi:predicted amidohydrolase YtcJ
MGAMLDRKEKRLYCNGTIYTADPNGLRAEAVAVSGDTIVAVGSIADCRTALDGPHETVDLGRRMLLPGFFDGHCHPLATIFVTMNTDLLGVRHAGELVDRFTATDRQGQGGDWMIGLNFEEQSLTPPVMPTRIDLDRVSTQRPVVVLKRDGHSVIANTRAMELAGVSAHTPDPAGGTIEREAGGRPSGIFRETAGALILDQIPLPDEGALMAGADATAKKWLGYGITSLGVMLQTDDSGPAGRIGAFDIPVMQLLRARFPQSIYGLVITRDTAAIAGLKETMRRDANLRIGGLKIITDGTFGSCTAAMNQPFADHPDRSGFFLMPPETVYRLMEGAHVAGHQVAVHAIGDRAMRTVVDLFDRLLTAHPRDGHRHRIEHAAIIDAAMIEDIRRLGLILSVQPMFIHSEKGWLEKRLGPERARITYPFADVVRAGIPMAGSSDAPVESQSVLHAIQCCVTREGLFPEQAIGLDAAIAMYTIDAARSQFAEDRRGTISPGKQADLVIVAENLFDVDPQHLDGVPVVETIVAGTTCHRA